MPATDAPQQNAYECPECGLHYESEDIMKRCEAWCAEHKSCNLDIIKRSEESKSSKTNV